MTDQTTRSGEPEPTFAELAARSQGLTAQEVIGIYQDRMRKASDMVKLPESKRLLATSEGDAAMTDQNTCSDEPAKPQGGYISGPGTGVTDEMIDAIIPRGQVVTAEQVMASRPPCRHCGGTSGHTWQEGDCLFLDQRHRGHIRADVGHLCTGCVDRIKANLADVAELYATLWSVYANGSVPDNTAQHKHLKGDSAPAPMRLEVLALTDPRNASTADGYLSSDTPDVPGMLHQLAERLCEDRGLAGASLNGTVSTSVRLLTEHADYLAGLPWVDEADAEISWLRSKLRSVHGLKRDLVGECMTVTDAKSCQGKVWADPDGGPPRCAACGRLYGRMDLVRLRITNEQEATG